MMIFSKDKSDKRVTLKCWTGLEHYWLAAILQICSSFFRLFPYKHINTHIIIYKSPPPKCPCLNR